MILESVQHRALAAVRFTDAITELPLRYPVTFQVEAVELRDPDAPSELVTDAAGAPAAVRFLRNRRDLQVLVHAPLLEQYVHEFDAPTRPTALSGRRFLRIRMRILEGGPHHLPRRFHLDLPRSTVPGTPDSVFRPLHVPLLPAPNAPVAANWSRLRIRLTRRAADGTDTQAPLGGVLLEAYRVADGALLGRGMTEWRHFGAREARTAGEALVCLRGIRPFVPGEGGLPMEAGERIRLEAVRNPAFGATDSAIPDLAMLEARTGDGLIVANGTELVSTPSLPQTVGPGTELRLRVTMR